MWRGFGVSVGLAGAIVSVAGAQETTASEVWSIPPVRVVDEAGQPLPDSEAAMIKKDSPMRSFYFTKADAGGQIQFQREDFIFPEATKQPEGAHEVLVLSKGKSPVIAPIVLPGDEPLVVQMPGGEAVNVKLNGPADARVPESVVPRLYPMQYGAAALQREKVSDGHDSPWVIPKGDGRFEVTVKETTAPWMLLVHEPSYLKAFTADFSTTSAIRNKLVEIDLPAAGSISQELRIPADKAAGAAAKFFSFAPSRLTEFGKESRMYLGATDEVVRRGDQEVSITHNNLAPGQYWVTFSEQTSATGAAASQMALFREGESVELDSGETTSVVVEYKEFDAAKLRGNNTAHVSVTNLDGSPAANLPVVVRYFDRDFGPYTVTTGTLSDKGTTTITGLAGGDKSAPIFRLEEGTYKQTDIGRVQFDTAETSRSFQFQMAPQEGDIAPDVTLTDAYTSEPVKLSDFRGKIVFLDFWATWCGPCQGPMEHNQKMLTENEAAWKDKVVIVGASIDDKKQTVIDHVKQKGWDKVRHLWCGDDAWTSGPSKTYRVTGVPTALLIDQEGKIVWRGHPAGCDLEAEVTKLLK